MKSVEEAKARIEEIRQANETAAKKAADEVAAAKTALMAAAEAVKEAEEKGDAKSYSEAKRRYADAADAVELAEKRQKVVPVIVMDEGEMKTHVEAILADLHAIVETDKKNVIDHAEEIRKTATAERETVEDAAAVLKDLQFGRMDESKRRKFTDYAVLNFTDKALNGKSYEDLLKSLNNGKD